MKFIVNILFFLVSFAVVQPVMAVDKKSNTYTKLKKLQDFAIAASRQECQNNRKVKYRTLEEAIAGAERFQEISCPGLTVGYLVGGALGKLSNKSLYSVELSSNSPINLPFELTFGSSKSKMEKILGRPDQYDKKSQSISYYLADDDESYEAGYYDEIIFYFNNGKLDKFIYIAAHT